MADTWGGSWGTSWGGSWGVDEVVPPAVVGGGGGYYDEGYFRRRHEDEEKRRKRRKQLADDLARAIDRAVARVLGEDEPEPVEAPLATVDDGLAAIRDRLATLEALRDRLGQADAGLEALRRRALALIEQARLDDDDEAIELLLMVM